MNDNPKLEPINEVNLVNSQFPNKTESELEQDLEHLLSPEAVFNFVRLHYMNDDGNDTPPSSAEIEELFRSYVSKLGYKGPKIERFIQNAMQSIDDYDYTDKFDNIDQSLQSSYGKKIFGNDLEVNSSDFIIDKPKQAAPSFKEKHKNNPFYIDPFAPNKPF